MSLYLLLVGIIPGVTWLSTIHQHTSEYLVMLRPPISSSILSVCHFNSSDVASDISNRMSSPAEREWSVLSYTLYPPTHVYTHTHRHTLSLQLHCCIYWDTQRSQIHLCCVKHCDIIEVRPWFTHSYAGGWTCDPRNECQPRVSTGTLYMGSDWHFSFLLRYGGRLNSANSRFGTVRCRPTTSRIGNNTCTCTYVCC